MKHFYLLLSIFSVMLSYNHSFLYAKTDPKKPVATKERCYGAVRAGQEDGKDPVAWLWVPLGICEKLANGYLIKE
jgi:uncharacterized membrane protein